MAAPGKIAARDIKNLLSYLNSIVVYPARKNMEVLLEAARGNRTFRGREMKALGRVWDRVHAIPAKVVLHAKARSKLQDIHIALAPRRITIEQKAFLEFALYVDRFDGHRPIIKCLHCGKWFQGVRSDSKTCSKQCCERYFRKQWRENIGEEKYREKQVRSNRRLRAKEKSIKAEIEKLKSRNRVERVGAE